MYLTSSYWKMVLLILMFFVSVVVCGFRLLAWEQQFAPDRMFDVIFTAATGLIVVSFSLFAFVSIQNIIECEEREQMRQISARSRRRCQWDGLNWPPPISDYEVVEIYYNFDKDNAGFLEKEAHRSMGKSIVFDAEGGFRWE